MIYLREVVDSIDTEIIPQLFVIPRASSPSQRIWAAGKTKRTSGNARYMLRRW